MANEVREIEKRLKEAGFVIVKVGKKHIIYGKGSIQVPVPKGTKVDWRWVKATSSVIRRAAEQEGGGK